MKAILKRNGNRGAGLTEYIIVVGLIGLGTLGGVMLYGDNIRGLFSTAGNSLAGVDSTPATRVVPGAHGRFGGGIGGGLALCVFLDWSRSVQRCRDQVGRRGRNSWFW